MSELNKLNRDFREVKLLWALSKPGYWIVINFRLAAAARRSKYKIFYYLYAPVWWFVSLATSTEISPRTDIGEGFQIVHFGQIFINSHSKLGRNVRIFNSVTVGVKDVHSTQAPVIGDEVEIGVGAKVLGNITIGDGCIIGANAVVTKSFGPLEKIAGIPAKSIGKVESSKE